MEFIENYPVSKLQAADYNPRKINKSALRKLKESITKFGIVKPIIINGENGILTAGHQRTKALKNLNIEFVPVIKLEGIEKSDEIMFNLFHNSVETNLSSVRLGNIENLSNSYHFIDADNIFFSKNLNPVIVKEIGKLIIKYGTWGSVICDEDGKVIINSEYAIACKLLNKSLLVYKMDNTLIKDFKNYIALDYGKYYFDTLNVKDYNQTFCQMNRLAGEKGFKSSTYENYVIPVVNKSVRILDFGAGKCAYPLKLKKKGYNIFMYEPFIRKNGSNLIDIEQVINFINEIEKNIKKHGLYDIVILDSVLNSITSMKMLHNVLLSCNALLKNNGKLILGTRSKGKIISTLSGKHSTDLKRDIEFLDDNNFSVTFRNGVWTKQRFTTKENLSNELKKYFHEVSVMGNENKSNIYAICKKPLRYPIKDYNKVLNIEFNMEYPNGFKHNMHKNLVRTLLENLN